MGKIDYSAIYNKNKHGWFDMTEEPEKYEALLSGHYSDSNHFIYELLQNAEDEQATKVVFEYYDDKLIFYHNGLPFDEDDVKGVSSMLMGTKDRNSAQTIGRFGMGFKSVFKYTYQPEIYSDDEAFRIERYLLPVETENSWDYKSEKETLCYDLSSGSKYLPFAQAEHLTKIIIPFAKKDYNANIIEVKGDEVLKKLHDLDIEILLFLTFIKKLYWVDKKSGKHAMISLDESKEDTNIKTCRIEGSEYGSKEEIVKYLKFAKKFDHPEMKAANVSVAYRLNTRSNNINEMSTTNVWVYFPTKDDTKFPFLIHGSFETAVSREKLMEPSDFNKDLYVELGKLICDSLCELRDRNLITQMFLRKVLLVAMQENKIPNFKEMITETFLKNNLLPDKSGNYRKAEELSIAVPFGIADFMDMSLFADSFRSIKAFVQFNNEKESNFSEYYNWLKDALHINVFNLESWAKKLRKYDSRKIGTNGKEYEVIKEFYAFLSDYRESFYTNARSSYGSYSMRSGPYEKTIRECLSEAWKSLRQSAIILNADGSLIAAFHGKNENLYLNSSSQYKRVIASALVNTGIAKEFRPLLEDGFQLREFNNFQYVKEKVVNKYIDIESDINFENSDDYDDEYVEDINQIIKLIDETHEVISIQEMLKNAYIIRVITDEGEVLFSKPGDCYIGVAEEGTNLDIYYKKVTENYDPVDSDFYNSKGISIKKLQNFGLVSTVVNEGRREFPGGSGNESWKALGEYCPKIEIDCLSENILYIEENPDEDLSKEKSAEILKLLLKITSKLAGTVRHRKTSPYDLEEESRLLRYTIKSGEWLYNKNEELCSITGMSKYDLNTEIYGRVVDDKDAYVILGFIETEVDTKAEAFELVSSMEERDQKILLKQLARKYGLSLTEEKDVNEDDIYSEEDIFSPEEWVSKDFPDKRVKNRDSLVEHVRQEFFCADPVKYQQVLRQIRVSKNPRIVRSYAMGMYTNDSNVRICQMCKEAMEQVEVTAIANYGIEMNQLNLCLCRNCAGKFKMLRENNKDRFKNEIKNAICSLEVDDDSDYNEYEVELNSENSLHFTQTHLVEIQTVFELLEEYGLPESEQDFNKTVSGPLNHPGYNTLDSAESQEEAAATTEADNTVENGSFVVYKTLGSGELKEATINHVAYPLHKEFVGKREGDKVFLSGRQYEIISIL